MLDGFKDGRLTSWRMIRFILPLLLTAGMVQARLGETLAECETRYGPVVERTPAKLADSDKEACIFSKEGVTITVEFRNNTAWKLTYRLAQAMIDPILATIAPPSGWASSVTINGRQMMIASTTHDQVAVVELPVRRRDDPAEIIVASRAYTKANRADYEARLASLPNLIKERQSARPLQNF
jgi:hypothetical protein